MNSKIIVFIRRMLISGCIFFAVSIPFREFLSLIPGMTEVRPANVVPPVMGIMFGLPAACGISIGNFISDMISGTSLTVSISGFAANFLYAYIPYKMWYTMGRKKTGIKTPSLNSVGEMLRYIYIIFVDSLVVTALLTFIFENAGFSPVGDSAVLLFFNNFDFAMILGVPVLALIGNTRLKFQIPEKRNVSSAGWKFWDAFSVIPYAVMAVGISYFIYSKLTGGAMNPVFTETGFLIMSVLLCIYIFRPMKHDVIMQSRDTAQAEDAGAVQSVKMTIKAKVTVGFIMVAVVFITFSVITTYMAILKNDNLNRLEIWSYVYFVAGAATNIIFAVTLAFLWYVERNITNPVTLLSDVVFRFAKQDHLKDGDNELLQEQCKEIRTGDEIENLAVSFRRMMGDISYYVTNLALVTAEKERIGAELDIATNIQASMLPSIFPPFPERKDIDLFASMTPAKEVGGDFYDFFMTDDTHLALVMADVSGKGVPAALFMVIAKTLLKNAAQQNLSPKDVLEKVNKQLCENNEQEMFVTVWLGIIDLTTGVMVCANAGHEFPAICRRDGKYELFKDKHGLVLAGMDMAKYKEYELVFEPGDSIFVYTDGVPEATNGNEELFGTDRMIDALNRIEGAQCEELLKHVREEVDEFVGDAPQFDDLTMLTFVYNGNGIGSVTA